MKYFKVPDAPNGLMLQKHPDASDQVKQEMKKLQDLGFIKKVKDLPQNVQDEL